MFDFIFALAAIILPPCQYEDVTNCYWSAETQGNGQGLDFFTIDGNVYTLENVDNWLPTSN